MPNLLQFSTLMKYELKSIPLSNSWRQVQESVFTFHSLQGTFPWETRNCVARIWIVHSSMNMEAADSFETLAATHHITLGRIPQNNNPFSYRCDNLKFHVISVLHQILIRLAGHVTCTGDIRCACSILVETQMESDLGTDIRTMLEGFLKNILWRCWLD
jgi:hypothetical protein